MPIKPQGIVFLAALAFGGYQFWQYWQNKIADDAFDAQLANPPEVWQGADSNPVSTSGWASHHVARPLEIISQAEADAMGPPQSRYNPHILQVPTRSSVTPDIGFGSALPAPLSLFKGGSRNKLGSII